MAMLSLCAGIGSDTVPSGLPVASFSFLTETIPPAIDMPTSRIRRAPGSCAAWRTPHRTLGQHCRPAIGSLDRSSPTTIFSETPNTPAEALHSTAVDCHVGCAGRGRTHPHKPIRDLLQSPQSARACLCVDRLPAYPSSSRTGPRRPVLPRPGERSSSVRPSGHRVPASRHYSTESSFQAPIVPSVTNRQLLGGWCIPN